MRIPVVGDIMTLSDFTIGEEFSCGQKHWRCTDIGKHDCFLLSAIWLGCVSFSFSGVGIASAEAAVRLHGSVESSTVNATSWPKATSSVCPSGSSIRAQ